MSRARAATSSPIAALTWAQTRRPTRLRRTAGRTTCRQPAVYNPPDQVNNWNNLAIGDCTNPSGVPGRYVLHDLLREHARALAATDDR